MTLSARELSARTGISQGHLSKIETGKASISIKVLSQLCQFFNRPLNYLFQTKEELPQVLATLNIGEGPEKEGIKWFAEAVKRMTTDQISLILLVDPCQFGTVKNQVEYLQRGIIDLVIEDLYLMEKFVPDFNIFALPYGFSSIQKQKDFLNGTVFREMMQKPLLDKGIRFINPCWNWFWGVKRVLVSKKPIFGPDDVAGLKVRVFNSQVLIQYWENLGAKPIVIPWENTAKAFSNNEIDVVPSYKSLVYPLEFCRHAKYVTEIGDIASMRCVAMNESKYQLLAPDIQQALIEACNRAGDNYSKSILRMDKEHERLNIQKFDAVYIKGKNAIWQENTKKTQQNLIRKGIMSEKLCREMEYCNQTE